MASQQQIDANRQNAQKSTGPKTPVGKAAVSQNALTHGLTAELACINGEDVDEFDETRQSFEDELVAVSPGGVYRGRLIASPNGPPQTAYLPTLREPVDRRFGWIAKYPLLGVLTFEKNMFILSLSS